MAEADAMRYSRQVRFGPVGEQGHERIARSRVLICGCGALGSVIAERLARSGVGHLRIVDRDWVELSNLQRQALFTEEDAAEARPKAVAAAEALRRFNSSISIEGLVEDVTYLNMSSLAAGCDLILDGSDNFETRFLINDYCVQNGVPWVHGGCLGASGQVMSIVPSLSESSAAACFRCLLPELPPREALETCDSAGVLGSAIGIVANWQVAEALKILSGNLDAVLRGLLVIDSWNTQCRTVALGRQADCPACGRREFPFLHGKIRSSSTVLCGKNAVQIDNIGLKSCGGVDELADLAGKLCGLGLVTHNPYFVRLQLRDHQVTVFRGGRTVVEGTTCVLEAKNLLARTLGA